jgi:hypothetical protein
MFSGSKLDPTIATCMTGSGKMLPTPPRQHIYFVVSFLAIYAFTWVHA